MILKRSTGRLCKNWLCPRFLLAVLFISGTGLYVPHTSLQEDILSTTHHFEDFLSGQKDLSDAENLCRTRKRHVWGPWDDQEQINHIRDMTVFWAYDPITSHPSSSHHTNIMASPSWTQKKNCDQNGLFPSHPPYITALVYYILASALAVRYIRSSRE